MGGDRRRVATRILGACALALGLLGQTLAAGGPSALAAGGAVELQIAGRAVVFAGAVHEGAIYLSQNGYALINPGFDFQTGTETSGLGSTPDIELQTGGATPYAVAGKLAVVPATDVLGALGSGQSVAPVASEELVVQDSAGHYVLVRIVKVTADVLTFTYVFGTAGGQAAAVGATVRVLGHTLAFPGPTLQGKVVLEGQGEVSVSPGFDFETGLQVNTQREAAGLAVSVSGGGQTTLTGDLTALNARGQATAWPAPASAVPADGDAYLLVDGAGNYVLVQVTAVGATAVSFTYRRLPARDLAVLPGARVTLRVDGASATFSGPVREGQIVASSGGNTLIDPGYDLSAGQEVEGLNASPDIALRSDPQGVYLYGDAATLAQLAAGQAPGEGSVPVTPFTRFVVVDASGQYVLVGVQAVSPQAVSFAYEIQTAGQSAVLSPPDPASVAAVPVPKGPGAIIYSAYATRSAAVLQDLDPASTTQIAKTALALLNTEELALGPNRIWPFADANASQEPELSPDGRWLATVDGGLIQVRSAAGPVRTIAANGNVMDGAQPRIAWSPDSRYLAYTGLASGQGYETGGALWVIDPSTGKSRLLVNPLTVHATVLDVAWLPHDRLVFSTASTFYEVSADWQSAQPLPVRMGTIGQDGRFAASPDGKLLAWVARDAAGHYQVVVATVDGRQRVQFTHTHWDNWSPVFSPDSTTVVCVSHTGSAPGGELLAFTLNGKQSGFVPVPGAKTPIQHVFNLVQWFGEGAATAWKG